jgi:hypothetical protein
VRAADNAAAGKARLTVSFTGPKEWGVAPAELEIPQGKPAEKKP